MLKKSVQTSLETIFKKSYDLCSMSGKALKLDASNSMEMLKFAFQVENNLLPIGLDKILL